MKKILIAPSTHPAREKIAEYTKVLIDNNVDIIHCDIMDGNFVQDKTFDYNYVEELKNTTTIPLDVHLMIKNAENLAEYYSRCANIITFQYESFDDKSLIIPLLKKYRSSRLLVGLSLNPDTLIKDIEEYLPYIDLLLVMSVVAGASGQTFIKHTIDRIIQINAIKKDKNYEFLVEVDGGINDENIQELKLLNVDIAVVGSALHKADNFENYYKKLKE